MCVCPWRLALQKEGWRQQMDEIRAVMTVEQLLFALSWSPKMETGAAILPEEGKASKMAAPFPVTRVLHTLSATPLRAVSSGDSGTFSFVFLAMGLNKASSKFHIEGPPSRMHFSY